VLRGQDGASGRDGSRLDLVVGKSRKPRYDERDLTRLTLAQTIAPSPASIVTVGKPQGRPWSTWKELQRLL
jgi:hypothetical protein